MMRQSNVLAITLSLPRFCHDFNIQAVSVHTDIERIGTATNLTVFNIGLFKPCTQINKSCAVFATVTTLIFCRSLHSLPHLNIANTFAPIAPTTPLLTFALAFVPSSLGYAPSRSPMTCKNCTSACFCNAPNLLAPAAAPPDSLIAVSSPASPSKMQTSLPDIAPF